MSKIINGEEFKKEVIDSKAEVLVDFYADWCGPCKMLSPIMDEISKEKTVFKVNVDDEQDLAMEYGVMSIPCVIAFKDGKVVNRSVGLVDKNALLKLLED